MSQDDLDEKLDDIRELAGRLSSLSDKYEEMRAEIPDGPPEWQMAYSMISQSLESVATKVEALSESTALAS